MSVVAHEVVKRPGYEALTLHVEPRDLTLPGAIMDVKSRIFGLMRDESYGLVVVDSSNLERVSTDGFAMLLGIRKRLKGENAAVRVAGLNPSVAKSYQLCMLHRIMPTSDTVAQAPEAFQKEASMQ